MGFDGKSGVWNISQVLSCNKKKKDIDCQTASGNVK